MVQINVHIDTKLKNGVKEVLEDEDMSMSNAVRPLWLCTADYREVSALETTVEE